MKEITSTTAPRTVAGIMKKVIVNRSLRESGQPANPVVGQFKAVRCAFGSCVGANRLGRIFRLASVALVLLIASSIEAAVISDVRVSLDNPPLGIVGGVVNCTVGSTYNGSRPVDVIRGQYLWRITGRGFGTLPGTVQVVGRSVTIVNWTDAEIIVDPWAPYVQWPVCGLVTVYPRAGSSTAFALNIVPSCYKTVFSQCTWWVSHRRWQAGLSPASYAYPMPLDSSWIPRALDYVIFTSVDLKHVALVESVSRRLDGTYDLRMSDYNADGRNGGPRCFTTQFNPLRGIVPVANASGTLKGTGWKR